MAVYTQKKIDVKKAAEEDAKMATEATASPTAAATVSTSGAATGAAAAGDGTSAGAPAMASPLASLQLCLHELLHAILSFLLRLNEGGGSARLRSTGHGLVHVLLPLAAEPFFGCLCTRPPRRSSQSCCPRTRRSALPTSRSCEACTNSCASLHDRSAGARRSAPAPAEPIGRWSCCYCLRRTPSRSSR
jgi:hypothetical protein